MKNILAHLLKLPSISTPLLIGLLILGSVSFIVPSTSFADVPPVTAPSLTLTDTVSGGSATTADWTLTATGATTTPSDLSGISPVSSDSGFLPDTYTLSESGDASTTNYTAGTWSCTGATVSGDSVVLASGQTATCTIVNTYNAPPAPVSTTTPVTGTVTVVGSLIICGSESDMPRWGLGGHIISTTTASDFVAAITDCHLQSGWNFEWGNQNVTDPGRAFVGPAGSGAGYTEFGPTDTTGSATTTVSLSGLTQIDVREVLQSGYIPFGYDQTNMTNSATTSAEFYCANDALNYDNWDFIRSPIAGTTYYCVGFNVPTTVATSSTSGGGTSTSTNPSSTSGGITGGGGTSGVSGGGGGGTGGSGEGSTGGLHPEVLGAFCGPILSSYLRLGKTNPSDQVEILQNFLNGELGINLPVTGFFGPLTEKAVDEFQLKYGTDVLAPWVPHGLPSATDPTGYVYKTTKWKINMISCPSLDLPVPSLP